MGLQLGFKFADLTKAWDGWFGMIQSFRLWLHEELFTEKFSFVLSHAVFGCALLLVMATILSVGTLIVSVVRVWELSDRLLPAGISQRRWHPTNELSPPA